MSYDNFKAMILALAKSCGLGKPRFNNNVDKKRYEARLRDDIFITGSMSKPSLTYNMPNHDAIQIPISQLGWAS